MSTAPASEAVAAPRPERLKSLDAYRGFTMLLMALSAGSWLSIAEHFPDSRLWQFLADQLEHRPWGGNCLWDMIQPSFMFMVGVSLPYSAAKRQAEGQSYGWMFLHAVIRALLLIFLGVFLRSKNYQTLNWTLIDVLSQIGLGYVFLFLLWGKSFKLQLSALALILVGYWSLFAFWPPPDSNYDLADWGVTEQKAQHNFTGFAARWNFNAHPAAYFDRWIYNQFPRPLDKEGNPVGPYKFDRGGYSVLNFVPSLATMILGLMVGNLLRSMRSSRDKLLRLLTIGACLMAAGWLLDYAGICPIVKRIWTPSWVLFSGGWCFWILAGLYGVMDLAGYWRWAFPGIVAGMNPITLYVLSGTLSGWIADRLRAILGRDAFQVFGAVYEPLVAQLAVLLVLWLIVYWMYRRKIFVRL